MDFNYIKGVLNADAIENGSLMHIRRPTGLFDPMYRPKPDGTPDETKPLRALVRSQQSKAWRDHQLKTQAHQASQARQMRGKTVETVVIENERKREIRDLKVLLLGLENCTDEKEGMVELSDDDLAKIIADPDSHWLVNQVINYSKGDDNYETGVEGAKPPQSGGD